MNDNRLHSLCIVDSATVARRCVIYCEEVLDPHLLLGKRFRCATLSLEIQLDQLSTCGTATWIAFAYSGDQVPSGVQLAFHELP